MSQHRYAVASASLVAVSVGCQWLPGELGPTPKPSGSGLASVMPSASPTSSNLVSQGQNLFNTQGCASCHSLAALAGKTATDLNNAIASNLGGVMGNKSSLAADQRNALGAYLSSLGSPSPSASPSVSASPSASSQPSPSPTSSGSYAGDVSNGGSLWANKGCAGCHGADAKSGFAGSLVGVTLSTLVSQQASGSVMKGVLSGLTTNDLADLAAYIDTTFR